MESQFRAHLKAVKYWAARQPNMRIQYVSYTETVNSPADVAKSSCRIFEPAP
ncbi:MAG: hypothetical protein HC797_10155 [Anaerolineales bacterium]|nr:hypothetical protein [Anaerolineales bacterium]